MKCPSDLSDRRIEELAFFDEIVTFVVFKGNIIINLSACWRNFNIKKCQKFSGSSDRKQKIEKIKDR